MNQIRSDATDVDLISSLRQGNQHALSIIYDRYGGLVYTLALKLLDCRDGAEDLTQDVFLSFWKQAKFDPTRAKLSSYLCLVTRSRAIDKLRSRRSEQKSIERLQRIVVSEANLPIPLDWAIQSGQQTSVLQALAMLSQQQRDVLELSYYHDLSQSAIATQLNLPLGTVKTRMRQGLIKLRQLLQS